LHDAVLVLDRLQRAELAPGVRVLITAVAGSLGLDVKEFTAELPSGLCR
jgi:hypothetical protein